MKYVELELRVVIKKSHKKNDISVLAVQEYLATMAAKIQKELEFYDAADYVTVEGNTITMKNSKQ